MKSLLCVGSARTVPATVMTIVFPIIVKTKFTESHTISLITIATMCLTMKTTKSKATVEIIFQSGCAGFIDKEFPGGNGSNL